MDNPTHTLVGLMLSRAGLHRFAGPRSSLLLMLAANAPDADAISWLWGSVGHLQYHRWYTHSWLLLPLTAILPVLVTRLFTKEGFHWGKMYLLALIGVASHILLDMTNSYGVRALVPMRADWLSWDTTFVIDPFIWGALTLAVGGPFLSSLVSSEIGAKKSTGQGWAIFALLFIALYDAGRWMAHERAIEVLNSRIYNGAAPKRVGAFPEFANPMRWSAVVELSDAYWVSQVDLLQEFDPTAGRLFYKPGYTPEIERAKATEPFRVFGDFNQWPLWRTTPMAQPEGSVKVELFDLRFGNPVDPGFKAEAHVLAGGKGMADEPEFRFGQMRVTPRER